MLAFILVKFLFQALQTFVSMTFFLIEEIQHSKKENEREREREKGNEKENNNNNKPKIKENWTDENAYFLEERKQTQTNQKKEKNNIYIYI